MKYTAALLIFFASVLSSSSANAWFFFFMPGSVTGKIADAVTGAEGENCVGPNAKVGDIININGALMTIKSVSGASSRCTNAAFPIRALLEPPTQKTSQARIDLPDGWVSQPLSDAMRAFGTVLFTLNKSTDSGLMLYTAKRSDIPDMMAFAVKRRALHALNMSDVHQSEIRQLTVGGLRSWRFESTAKAQTGAVVSRIVTIVEGEQEIVITNIWTSAARFEQQKESLLKVVDSLTGLSSTSSHNVVATPSSATVVALPSNKTAGASQIQPTGPTTSSNSSTSATVSAQKLRELSALFKDGVISKEEFEDKKKEILKSM